MKQPKIKAEAISWVVQAFKDHYGILSQTQPWTPEQIRRLREKIKQQNEKPKEPVPEVVK